MRQNHYCGKTRVNAAVIHYLLEAPLASSIVAESAVVCCFSVLWFCFSAGRSEEVPCLVYSLRFCNDCFMQAKAEAEQRAEQAEKELAEAAATKKGGCAVM